MSSTSSSSAGSADAEGATSSATTTATTSATPSCEELKSQGNELFIKNDFVGAEALYTRAITEFDGSNNDHNKAILYTNRSAARLGRDDYAGALEDSEKAIAYDPTWTKAYYRKATALEKLGRHRECFHTWKLASVYCESTPWLTKQIKSAAAAWVKKFKSCPIESNEDLIERYRILGNTRQRLSTMAHFWNESTAAERFNHFNFLLSVIGGEGQISEVNQRLSESHMQPMPLHNYVDLPRDAIAFWCDYFHEQTPESKTQIMHAIWEVLDNAEKDAVLADLKLFVARAYEMEELLKRGSAVAGGDNDDLD
jgi:tetratricopeptide (TPR) repeat protein